MPSPDSWRGAFLWAAVCVGGLVLVALAAAYLGRYGWPAVPLASASSVTRR